MDAMFLASALNSSIPPPVLVTNFNISGGNEHAIFIMGAMFLASALNRGVIPPEILKMVTNTGGNVSV